MYQSSAAANHSCVSISRRGNAKSITDEEKCLHTKEAKKKRFHAAKRPAPSKPRTVRNKGLRAERGRKAAHLNPTLSSRFRWHCACRVPDSLPASVPFPFSPPPNLNNGPLSALPSPTRRYTSYSPHSEHCFPAPSSTSAWSSLDTQAPQCSHAPYPTPHNPCPRHPPSPLAVVT